MALLPWSIVASAEEYDFDDGILKYNITSTEYHEVACAGFVDAHKDDTSVTIPGNVTYNNTSYAVKKIEFGAFYHSNLISVYFKTPNLEESNGSIYNGIRDISGAFQECTNLEKIQLPEYVSNISNAFSGCTKLTKIEIPLSVEGMGYAFYGCTKLESVNWLWQENLNGINMEYAFYGCTALQSIKLPSISHSISMNYAFYECTKLKSIEMPNHVSGLDHTFYGCTELTEIDIPEGVNELPQTFHGCSKLKSANIPNGVTSISYAFSDCTELASVNIPEGVVYMNGAFSGCTGLTEIKIPKSVDQMTETFHGCTGLTSVEIAEGSFYTLGTFRGCTGLKSVKIADGASVGIGTKTFDGCTSLTSIELPATLSYITEEAFKDCSSLTSLDIPGNPSKICCGAFSGCKKLVKLTFHALTAPEFLKHSENQWDMANNPSCPNDLCEEELYKQITLITPKGATGYDTGVWLKFNRASKANLSDDVTLVEDDEYYPRYLTYTRDNLTSSTYATFCLPFSTNLSDVADKFEAVYTTNGTALYKPDGKLVLMLKKIGIDESIPAGQAFVGKLNSTATEVTFANNAIIITDENTMQNPEPQKLEVYDWDGTSGLLTENTDISVSYGGALTTMTGKGSDYETFNSNGTFGPTADGTVKAFRAYVVKNNAATKSKVRSISLGIDDETTGVNIIAAPAAESADNAIYTIDGTLVRTDGSVNRLPSGIYIKNHKKIIIK